MSDLPATDGDWWSVSINGNQGEYVFQAPSAGDAASIAGVLWREDEKISAKAHSRGIYDIRVRRAKFGMVSRQPVISVTQNPETGTYEVATVAQR